MKICFLLCLSFLFLSFSNSEKAIIESDRAFFDGQKVHLLGKVSLKHAVGTLQAEEVTLSSNDENSGEVDRIVLKDQIFLIFNEGGLLTAPSGEFNCSESKAHFESSVDCPVTFKKTDTHSPFQMTSSALDIFFNPEGKEIQNITAKGNTALSFCNIQAFCDQALYSKIEQENHIRSEQILLNSTPPNGCSLICRQDMIETSSLLIDTGLKTLLFKNPHGFLHTESEPIQFSADTMQWDENNNCLVLQNQVCIEEPSFGRLVSEGPIYLYRNEDRKISLIECKKPVVITRHDPETHFCHTLQCYGTMTIDPEKMTVWLTSPKETDGTVKKEWQIAYEDVLGTMTSDIATMTYVNCEGSVKPSKLVAEGDVQITNRFAPSKELQETYAQYILADKAEIFVETKEAFLSSTDRVLLFDKINRLELSAPAVKIKRNEATNKESIQGVGDARFVFVDHEFDKIKKRFLLEDVDKP